MFHDVPFTTFSGNKGNESACKSKSDHFMLLNTAYPKMDFRGVVKMMTIPLKFSLGIIAIKTSKNSCCEILVPLILDIPFTSTCLISVTLSLSGYFNKIGCLINFIEMNSFFFS